MTPVFTYYMLNQSRPGAAAASRTSSSTNLTTRRRCARYYDDLRCSSDRAREAGGPVVLHVEPDLWGYIQQAASGDDAATVPAKVAATGLGESTACPTTPAGFAQAIVRLRDSVRAERHPRLPRERSGARAPTSRCRTRPNAEVDELAGARRGLLPLARRAVRRDLRASSTTATPASTSTSTATAARRGGGAADFARHVRFLRGYASADRPADRALADPAGQHADARDEQHLEPLPGQPRASRCSAAARLAAPLPRRPA